MIDEDFSSSNSMNLQDRYNFDYETLLIEVDVVTIDLHCEGPDYRSAVYTTFRHALRSYS